MLSLLTARISRANPKGYASRAGILAVAVPVLLYVASLEYYTLFDE